MLTPYTRQKAKFSFGEKTASLRRGEDEDKGKEEYDFSSAFTCRPLQEESMSVPIEKRGESTFPKMLRCFSPSPFVSFGSDTKAPDPSFHRLDAQDFLFITLTR